MPVYICCVNENCDFAHQFIKKVAMKQGKGILGILVVFAIGTIGLRAEDTLYIKEKTGNRSSVALSEIRKLEFSESNMVVTDTQASTLIFALTGIRSLSFRNHTTGISGNKLIQPPVLIVYPNPVRTKLFVKVSGDLSSEGKFEIVDLKGRILYLTRMDTQTLEIDVGRLLTGVYICRLRSGPGIYTKRFIKEE